MEKAVTHVEKPNTPKEKVHLPSSFGIIRSAIEIPCRFHSFVLFTFPTSLPLLCAMLLPRLLARQDFIDRPDLTLRLPPPNKLMNAAKMALDVATPILRAILFDQVNFLTAVSTIYSASKFYTTSGRSMSLQDLLQNFITNAKWNGPPIAFLDMSLLSLISLYAITYWGGSGPLVSSSNMFLQVIHGVVYFGALSKWLEYSALWHSAVVISVLEEKRGFEAFSSAVKLSKGRRIAGLVLMLVYSVWKLSLAFPTLFGNWSFPGGVVYAVLDSSLLCVGRVMSWVIFVVYYHDCKNRHTENTTMEDGERNELYDTNVQP